MTYWDRSSVVMKKEFFFPFTSLYYTAQTFLYVSLLIVSQLKAETLLTKHKQLKLKEKVRLGELT